MAVIPTLTTQAVGSPAKADWANGEVDYALGFLLRPPMVKAYRSANLTALASGTYYLPNWDLEAYDTDTMHDPASPNLITIKTAGIYLIVAHVILIAGTGVVNIHMRKNAAGSLVGGSRLVEDGGGSAPYARAITTEALALNDTVECFVQQTSGSNQNLLGTAGFSYFSAQLVSLV